MTDFNRNARWCRVLLDELVAAGLRTIVTCTGGRAAAMSLVAGDRADLRRIVHVDERSGAFLALGAARASGAPSAITTTSGSSVANLLRALVEAYQTRTPLVLLTCDRPNNQRGTGAPQTTNQIRCCEPFVVASADLPEPRVDEQGLTTLRQEIRRVAAFLTGPGPVGPVHINIPLAGRLDSTEADDDWQPEAADAVPLPAPRAAGPGAPAARALDGDLIDRLGLRPGLRGLIVAGFNPLLSAGDIARFSETTGFPVLADAPSNLRRPLAPNVIAAGDVLVVDQRLAAQPPEIIVRVGDAPVSHFMAGFLARQACPVVRIDGVPYPRDYPHRAVTAIDRSMVDALARTLARGDERWLQAWLAADAKVHAGRSALVAGLPWGEVRAASIVCEAPFPVFHVANSMPMRHANLFCDPSTSAQRIFANRGVNGIDGTIGTFLGEAWASGEPALLLIGDQAMLHDLPALEATRERSISGCICIMNNGGGAIFDLLDCSRLPGYERSIRNPTPVRFEAIAAAFGLAYRRADSAAALRESLDWSRTQDGVQVVEVVVPPDSLKRDITTLFGKLRGKPTASM